MVVALQAIDTERPMMVKIRRVDATLMDKPVAAAKKVLTPLQRARLTQQRQFTRLIRGLAGPADVFEVKLGAAEKALTIRQRLLSVAATLGREVAVRKHGSGFLVGLMTPERRSKRGRPKAGS
jgi:hypothetical protein